MCLMKSLKFNTLKCHRILRIQVRECYFNNRFFMSWLKLFYQSLYANICSFNGLPCQ